MGTRLPGNVMNLQRFMLRSQVLKLYRDILRVLKKIPNEQDRNDMFQWVRDDFKKNKTLTDEEAIRMMLTHGKRQLKSIENTIPRGS